MADPVDSLFTTPEMAAIWSAESTVRGMLAFEAALAHAQSRAGITPDSAATAIADACRVERFDVATIYREAVVAGTPAIPLVNHLTAQVEGAAQGFVHWGATSQDALDTAAALQIRQGLELLSRRLHEVGAICAELAERHRDTLMAGRTLLRYAVPITFGLKAARWLTLITRQVRRLEELRSRSSVLQFGGAAGTLAALGSDGMRVAALLGEELRLQVPDLPWHAERDRVAEVAAGLGVVAGAMAKIANDLVLLAQSDVGEVAEHAAPGKGGSSTLPQKRNPIDATMAVACARLAIGGVPVVLGAMEQEHERAAGAWQAEWQALPELFRHTAGAVEHVRGALDGLEVHAERMRANLESSGGQIMAEALSMALARQIGRDAAQRVVREVSERAHTEGTDLRAAAQNDQRVRDALPAETLERAFDPAAYLGSTNTFIQRALDDFRGLPLREGEARAMTQRTKGDDGEAVQDDGAYVSVGGIRLHYRLDGPPDTPPIVFSNSLGTDLRMWERQISALAQRFRVICYDSRGHGRSDAPAGPYTLDLLGRDLLGLLDALGIERAHLCGLSLGGMVAQWMAIHHPERVQRLVLANTAARIGSEASWTERIQAVTAGGMSAIRDVVVARFLSPTFRGAHPDVTHWLASMVEATPLQGYIAACAALRDADLSTQVGRIRVPTLIVGGALDQSTPPDQARELHAAISDSKLLIFDEAAHLSNVEQADAFNTSLVEFLGTP